MSETFKRLSQDFALMDEVHGEPLSADKGRLRAWVNNLPRANPRETASLLYSGLVQSMKAKLSGTSRFVQLEEVREVTLDSIAWLERQFSGSTLPLVQDRLALAQRTINLHIALADGYRLACHEICAPAGVIPMFKTSQVNAALARSIWHYQQALYLNWKLYRANPDGVWLGMHRVFQYAREIKLENKDIEDQFLMHSVQVEQIYRETCLVSLMNPWAFAQSGQDQIKALAAGFASQSSISPQRADAQAVTLPLNADMPANSELPDEQSCFFSFTGLIAALEKISSDAGEENIDIAIANGKYLTLPLSILLKVKRSLGVAIDRNNHRQFEPFPIQTVVGFSNLHYFVAGKLNFNDYIQQLSQLSGQGLNMAADWVSLGTDVSTQQIIKAIVLDHSFGGYRIHWEQDPLLRVRVGEVIGLNVQNPESEPDWMIAVIRWLRYEKDNSVSAGLELISRRCHAVALRIYQNRQASALMRGLEVEPLADGLPRQFLMSGQIVGVDQQIEVFYSYQAYRIGIPRGVEKLDTKALNFASNMDYSLLSVNTQ